MVDDSPDRKPVSDQPASTISTDPPPAPASPGNRGLELFDDGRCNKRYPVTDFVQEFEFAQFIDFVAPDLDLDAGSARVATAQEPATSESAEPVKLILADPQSIASAAVTAAGARRSLVDVMGGVPLAIAALGRSALADARRASPPPQSFIIADVAAAASSGAVAFGDSEDVIRLGRTAIEQLEAGKPVRVGRMTANGPKVIELKKTVAEDAPVPPPSPPVPKADAAVTEYKVRSAAAEFASDEKIENDRIDSTGYRARAAPSFAAVIAWKQIWTLQGYSRGRLLNSLTLAPQEETVIELFSWDRHKRQLDQSQQTDIERSSDFEQKSQDISDVFDEMSNRSELERHAGVQFEGRLGDEKNYMKLNAEGKIDAKEGMTSVSKNNVKRINELTQKAASRVKSSRVTKISETMEVGREQRITRKVRNPNMCHTLSLDYYEVMVTYRVETQPNPDGAFFCLLMRNPFADPLSALHLPRFNREHLRVYSGQLRNSLTAPDLAAGFEAARYLEARERSKLIACDRYVCPQARPDSKGGVVPAIAWSKLPAWFALVDSMASVARIASQLSSASPHDWFTRWDLWQVNQNNPLPTASQAIGVRRWLFTSLLDLHQTELGVVLRMMASRTFDPASEAQFEEIRTLARRLMSAAPQENAAAAMRHLTAPAGTDIDEIFRPIINQYWDRVAEDWFYQDKLREGGLRAPLASGLPASLDSFVQAYRRFESAVAASMTPPATTPAAPGTALPEPEADDRLEYNFPLRETAEAMERESALLSHLNLFINYYRFALFRQLPPDEQMYHLTDGFQRRLGRLVQPRALTWRGEFVAMPIDAGQDPTLKNLLTQVRDGFAAGGGAKPFEVSMPTPGVTMDSRLGNCSACEPFIVRSREIELTTRGAEADQAVQEARRRRMRLDAVPPDLNPPVREAEAVRLKIDTSGGPSQ